MSITSENIKEQSTVLNKKLGSKEIFDPRIIDNNASDSKRIWNSESVDLANKGIKEGYKLVENPYNKNITGALLRKANLPFKYSEEELETIDIIYEDKEWFCDNFGKLKTPTGWDNITLRDYQRKLLKKYSNEKWNIVMFPRRSGKTTTTVLEIVHYILTNIDKDIAVIAQSDTSINEILSKIKECLAGLPFFLQPGFISFNSSGFTLDNGCRLTIGIASESTIQGFDIDFLYIDEFAYINQNMVTKFWNNVYPTMLNNPNSKCIITSTPNGRNKFWELWSNAERKINKFITSRIYWYDVPGRDEQFKLDTIANIGIEGWEMGFECSFDTMLKSIFTTENQKKLRKQQLENIDNWSKDNHYLGEIFDIEFIKQDLIPYNTLSDYFLISIDISEGLGLDSSTAKIRKICWDKKLKKLVYESVGVYRNNSISVEDFAEKILLLSKYFNKNKTRIIVENNTYGAEFFSKIKLLRLTESNKYDYFDNIILAKFFRDSKNSYEYGIRRNRKNKPIDVKSFSDLVKADIIRESNYLTIEEYLNFGEMKNGTYSAQYGNDDLIMADVSTAHFIKCNNIYSNEFLKDAEENLRAELDDEPEEIKITKEQKLKKENNIYKTELGFQLRDHVEKVNKSVEYDNMILMV